MGVPTCLRGDVGPLEPDIAAGTFRFWFDLLLRVALVVAKAIYVYSTQLVEITTEGLIAAAQRHRLVHRRGRWCDRARGADGAGSPSQGAASSDYPTRRDREAASGAGR